VARAWGNLGDQSRMMRWVGHVSCMREMRNAYKIFVGKPEETTEIRRDGRITSIWIFRDTGWEVVDWIHLAEDREQWQVLVNKVTNLWVL
jgi:hypothetical protein